LQQRLNTRDIHDEETSDWRAVCGKTARTVRREGRPKAFPTPIDENVKRRAFRPAERVMQ
jgi:hypothetical protein